MSFTLPRGMRDLEPEDYRYVEKIRATFMELAALFGFKVMEPSPLEMLNVLEAKSGPSVKDEIYYFKDKSGRDVGLRFDLTVGITRYVAAQRGIPLPFRVGAFSGMWRYDEPQLGRYRWFYQWDVETYGPSNPLVDSEIVEFVWRLFKHLGMEDVQIRIGDRNAVEEHLSKIFEASPKEMVFEVMRALDKIPKRGLDAVLEEYSVKGFPREKMLEALSLGDLRGEPSRVLSDLGKMGLSKIRDLTTLIDSLREKKVRNVSVDMGVVRGLDYYSGLVFEAFESNHLELGALAGGGRYDSLPLLFGRKDIGATGAAGGVDRTVLALKKREDRSEKRVANKVYVACASTEMVFPALALASDLREAKIPTEAEVASRSLRKQLEAASLGGVGFVVIVAPREYSEGKVVLKNMMTGVEEKISLSEVEKSLKRRLM